MCVKKQKKGVLNKMKRVGYLITEEKITVDYCKKIILKAAKGKLKREIVKEVLSNIELYSKDLREIVLSGSYQPAPYCTFNHIDEPTKKERHLCEPKFYPDLCVQHLIIDVIYDRLLKRLDPYAIASIKGRGIHCGYKAVSRWLNKDCKGTKYCLKGDIRKCYENIKPQFVFECFTKFIKDKKYLNLVEKVVNSYSSLPLGTYTSAWFENLLLLDMDTAVRKSNGTNYYVRYVDDFVVLSGNKRKLHRILEVIKKMLSKVGLWLKDNWQIFRTAVRGIDFLGYRFFPGYILLRKRNLLGLLRTLRHYIVKPCRYWATRLSCRLGNLRWFNSFNLRCCIEKQIDMSKLKSLCRIKN